MRKVLFKKWISKQYEAIDGSYRPVKNTGCFETDFVNSGLFHQWAAKFEEYESGPGNFTVALVETESGEIVEVLPPNVKFAN